MREVKTKEKKKKNEIHSILTETVPASKILTSEALFARSRINLHETCGPSRTRNWDNEVASPLLSLKNLNVLPSDGTGKFF